MPFYVCCLPNQKGNGTPKEFISDDPAKIEAWAQRHDRDGYGVYDCHNPLKPGATRRAKETIGAITRVVTDVDPKDVAETMQEADRAFCRLLLPPTEVRDSGRGRHVVYVLKEPIDPDDAEMVARVDAVRERLTEILGGDRQVMHQAALFRRLGTHNTKDGAKRPCRVLMDGGSAYDLTELEEMVALHDQPVLTRKPVAGQPATNGHDRHSPLGTAERATLVDVDARLRAMKFQGAGESAIHLTQLQVTAALLRTGTPLDDVVTDVLEATRAAMANDPRAAKWDWEQEEHDIRRMCCDFVAKNPELSAVLPEALRSLFEAALADGRRAKVVFAKHIGWHVRSFQDREGGAAYAASPNSPGLQAAKTSGWNYYDHTQTTPVRWLVKGLLPESGIGILAGQWGSFKTTAALDLAVSVMTGQAFAGQYKVKRKGAVLYFAVEGAGTLKARLEAIARHRGAPKKLPFAWRGQCPTLTAKGAGQAIVKCVDEAAAHFEHAYGLPITLIWIDTYMTAAGLNTSGDDNDAAATQKAFTELRFVATHTGAFVAVVDHYGKILEAGTRGSSGKEGNADTVLATLAERELTGAISNTRMAARKQRDGVSGFELPYTPEKVELGLDEDGDPITAIVLDWGKQQGERASPGRKSKTVRLLYRVLTEVTAAKGFPFQPDPGGPAVRAVHRKDLLAAFNERYHAEGSVSKRRNKRWMAYSRAIKAAVEAGLVGVRDGPDGEEIIYGKS
jgi:AAA domain